MLYFILWYLTLTLFALAALPLGWSWFRHLPDRGWGLLRPLGVLLVGFAVWFLGSLGLLRLGPGSGLGGLLLLFGLGLWLLHRYGGGWGSLLAWLREHRGLVLVQEALFLTAFAFWTWYRIHDPSGISHTEQPMDFAFLNAILRGGEMPPNDPWLSGFAISYYYLGYLMMAQVTALSGVASGVAYNLALTSIAAMAAAAIYSLVYNLTVEELSRPRKRPRLALAVPLLGPLLLLGISNLTGLLTMTYHRGIGPDALYQWFQVHGLTVDPSTGARAPQGGWWWWNASRTILDLDAAGNRVEVIDEFPFFSFLLGDLHPHVLVLPFVLLGLGVALNALRGAILHPLVTRWRGLNLPPESWAPRSIPGPLTLLLTTIILGGIGMTNTWDLPTLAVILAGVWMVAALLAGKEAGGRAALGGWLRVVAFLLAGAFILYLPFYLGFRSQAQGIRLSAFATLPQQYLLMFGLFWLVLVPLVLSQFQPLRQRVGSISGRMLGYIGAMLLVDGALLLALLRAGLPEEWLALLLAALWLLIPLAMIPLLGEDDPTPLLVAQVAGLPLLAGLVTQRWTMAIIAALLALALLALWARVWALLPRARPVEVGGAVPARPIIAGGSQAARPGDVVLQPASREAALPDVSLIFALGLAAVALLLTMGSEIFYIRDGFGGRMNTVFKLYYQAWLLMAVASSFGVVYLARRMAPLLRLPWLALLVLVTLGSLWYPVEALQSKAGLGGEARWDGRLWMLGTDPARLAAIDWLNTLPGQKVILEAPGNSYQASESALAGWTGHSTLIGWAGHQLQWRGTYDEVARREPVVQAIYESTDAGLSRILVDQWGIDYVAVTPLEIARYNLSPRQIEKFHEFMTPVFQQGDVLIFGR